MSSPRVLWAVSALLTLLAIACQWRIGFNNDNAWLLHLAARVLDGDRLYVDLVEINPPLIVWLNLPIAALARVAGLDPIDVFRGSVLLLALVTSWFSERLSRVSFPAMPSGTVFLLGVLVLLAVPVAWFGQREHLLLVLALPYLWLSAGRLGGRVERWAGVLPIAAGLLAGIGLALKPQFLGIWALVLWRGLRSRGRVLAWPENWAIGLVGMVYLAVVVVWTPEYISLVRLVGDAYSRYRAQWPPLLLVTRFESLVALTSVAIYAFYRRTVRYPALTDILALGAAGSLLGVVLQGKGFDYHYYPALGLAILLSGIVACAPGPANDGLIRRARLVSAALLILASGPYLQALVRIGLGPEHTELRAYRALEEAVGPVRGRKLLVLAPRSGYAYGLVTYAGANWVGRFPCLWLPPALHPRGQHPPPERMQPVERWFRALVISDAVQARPDVILVGIPTPGVGPEDYWFDFIDYFSRDPEFAALLGNYEETGHALGYRIFRRRGLEATNLPPLVRAYTLMSATRLS